MAAQGAGWKEKRPRRPALPTCSKLKRNPLLWTVHVAKSRLHTPLHPTTKGCRHDAKSGRLQVDMFEVKFGGALGDIEHFKPNHLPRFVEIQDHARRHL